MQIPKGAKTPAVPPAPHVVHWQREIRTVLLNKAHTLSNPCPYTAHQHISQVHTDVRSTVTQDSKGPKCEPAFSGAATATLWWSQERRLTTGLQMRGQGWWVVGAAHTQHQLINPAKPSTPSSEVPPQSASSEVFRPLSPRCTLEIRS